MPVSLNLLFDLILTHVCIIASQSKNQVPLAPCKHVFYSSELRLTCIQLASDLLGSQPHLQPCMPLSSIQPATPRIDDICTTYHPKCGRKTEVTSFETYGSDVPTPRRSYHPKPWLPFRSESEFTFAELTQQAGMLSKQVDLFLKLIHKLREDPGEHFLLKTHKDADHLWKQATDRHVPVCHSTLRPLNQWLINVFD